MTDPSLEQRIDRLEEAMADLARATAENKRDWLRHRAAMRRISAEGQARWDAAGERQASRDAESAAQWARHVAESDTRWARHVAESESWWARYTADAAAWRKQHDADAAAWREQRDADTAAWRKQHDADTAAWREQRDADAAAFQKEMRREFGELSRRLGTMAEDLVAPGVGRILRTVIGAAEDDITLVAVRMRRRNPRLPGEMLEFDVVAECGDYVLINETKGRLAPEHIPAFLERLGRIRTFFPEYAERRILGALASLYVDESLVRQGERQGLIVLGFGEDLMDVLNSPGFVPRAF